MNDTLVVIPTYDEAATIERVVRVVRSTTPQVDVLVVDDASPDGTGDLADGLAALDPAVHVLHRAGKEGLGAAYRAGLGWGLAHGYRVLAQMDGDGSHRPEELGRLLAGLGSGVDLVLGSRWVPGGEVVDWPLHRVLLSRAGNAYARLLLGLGVRDATGGFRVHRRAALEAVDLDTVHSQGYCFQVDMLRRLLAIGCTAVEVPISFVERELGESKMSPRIVAEALCRVTAWGAQRRAAVRPPVVLAARLTGD